MNNIPTAQEFLSDNIDRTHFPFIDEAIKDKQGDVMTILQCMQEFAQLHVEAALRAAAKNSRINYKYYPEINKESILNAYSKENIK